jgi:hypothetical protein
MNRLKTLNILVILSVSMLNSYCAVTLFKSSDLGANDKEIISVIVATIIIVTTTIIIALLIYSSIRLYAGVYKRQAQRIAATMLIGFGVVSDLLVLRFFTELSVVSKIIFIYFHALILLHAAYSFKKIYKCKLR